uniref:Uncharacterized protein n=1 Tax=Tetranychus urticae TaxID=32264 RepID=T1KR43_TETUR
MGEKKPRNNIIVPIIIILVIKQDLHKIKPLEMRIKKGDKDMVKRFPFVCHSMLHQYKYRWLITID